MKTKQALTIFLLLAFTTLLGGCGESEQEKFYRKANEGQKQAEEANKKAADDLKNFKPSSSPYKEQK